VVVVVSMMVHIVVDNGNTMKTVTVVEVDREAGLIPTIEVTDNDSIILIIYKYFLLL
jgi:hypothetical protein